MKISLPKLNGDEKFIEDKQSIVLIGANGSGKTRMSIWIDENNPEITAHRISAQKSLNIPDSVSPTNMEQAEEKLFYGTSNAKVSKSWLQTEGKKQNRWGNDPETHLLNDFQPLMECLMTEYCEKSIEYRQKHLNGDSEYKNKTKLEMVKYIWEDVVVHRKLEIHAGKIEALDIEDGEQPQVYNVSKMSDGERAIFYFISEALCAPKDSLIIIDEPENHLHKSILVRLWDEIENARPDCVFLYITHNLDFAASRLNSQIIWVKSFTGESTWDYELLNNEYFPDPLMMEILGNRQKVLLVEGTKEHSIDRNLYSKIYPEYNVIPLGGCNEVIQATKVYNELDDLNYVEVKAIIDRDRRDDDEIQKLTKFNIFVPKVAEVENFFLLPRVISLVSEKLEKDDPECIINSIQEKVIAFLKDHIDEQAILFTRKEVENKFTKISGENVKTVDQLDNAVANIQSSLSVKEIFKGEKSKLQKIIDESDLETALKVINHKGLLPYTEISNQFGWKTEYYINYVIRITGGRDEIGNQLRKTFRENIGLI